MKKKYITAFILGFVTLMGFSASVHAQSDTEFWFIAPHLNNTNDPLNDLDRPIYFMITTGDDSAVVTMEMPALIGFHNRVLNIAANTSCQIIFAINGHTPVDDAQLDTIQNNIIKTNYVGNKDFRGIHFTATAPVNIYYQVDGTGSKDLFALKGRAALGIEFYTPFQTLF
ncbi:MAG: hypothetical protein LBI60_06375, partial [Bacteroidales bacterium]|nr:hypothetical protein [Bacteroidales bacterium]